MNTKKFISVVGAREHNLKNISIDVPKEMLTVITGPSGSGKSTLALDILYAEGQRRYIESLSPYARQFLGMPSKPQVDRIDGLCPAIAIDQKTVGSNPRSTVGTITEIYDYIRVLFARIGKLHCYSCFRPVTPESPQSIAERLFSTFKDHALLISAPLAIEKKGEFTDLLERYFTMGYHRFLIDGTRYSFGSLEDLKKVILKKNYKHSIDVIIDLVDVTFVERTRLIEAVERAFSFGNGLCKVTVGSESHVYSAQRMCITCSTSFPEIEPRLFSFNSPVGACKHCHGLGIVISSDHEKEWGYYYDRSSMERVCEQCHGGRLNPQALAITIGNKSIWEVGELPVKKALEFFKNLTLSTEQHTIADRLLGEIITRYQFLSDVGLNYLTINRTARTLSGGEGQRIRLATQIGSGLSGVLYILDEPSIGLHQRDNDRLIETLKRLRDQGNTIVVVEHDLDTIRHADYVIDMGPAAGILGGAIIASGTPQQISDHPISITGAYLSKKQSIQRKQDIRKARSYLTITGAKRHNLKNIEVKIPLGVFAGVSGVSGSGKSTLIIDELIPRVKNVLKHKHRDLEHENITGAEDLDSLIVIDQSPIGRTSRSNPATYLGIFDEIRKLFASLPESNARGYSSGRFSFNVGEGRCNNCKGDGTLTISMHFLPDVIMTCPQCKGARYNNATLEIRYKNKNIADILAMSALQALDFFKSYSVIAKRIQLLCDVGLDYLQLGQSSTTLSGGEAQRIKLVDELAKRGVNTLYVLDEPTTGLHSADIEKLLTVLNRLVDKGNSVIIIEHNIDVLKTVDYLIDMGPEGGEDGGKIIAAGTPEQVAENPTSHTGRYLRSL